MRAAYGKGYCDALTEDSPGSLCVEARLPRPCAAARGARQGLARRQTPSRPSDARPPGSRVVLACNRRCAAACRRALDRRLRMEFLRAVVEVRPTGALDRPRRVDRAPPDLEPHARVGDLLGPSASGCGGVAGRKRAAGCRRPPRARAPKGAAVRDAGEGASSARTGSRPGGNAAAPLSRPGWRPTGAAPRARPCCRRRRRSHPLVDAHPREHARTCAASARGRRSRPRIPTRGAAAGGPCPPGSRPRSRRSREGRPRASRSPPPRRRARAGRDERQRHGGMVPTM